MNPRYSDKIENTNTTIKVRVITVESKVIKSQLLAFINPPCACAWRVTVVVVVVCVCATLLCSKIGHFTVETSINAKRVDQKEADFFLNKQTFE